LIKGLEISLRICNSSGITIFTVNRSSTALDNLSAGVYVADVEIPSLFLVPGSYSLNIGAHIPNIEVLAYHESLMSFEIEETGSAMALYNNVNYGVVLVNFPWKEMKTQAVLN